MTGWEQNPQVKKIYLFLFTCTRNVWRYQTVSIIRKSKKDRKYQITKRKNTKRQTMTYKTLHRKLKIDGLRLSFDEKS
jgi:hypothetical protein